LRGGVGGSRERVPAQTGGERGVGGEVRSGELDGLIGLGGEHEEALAGGCYGAGEDGGKREGREESNQQ